MGHVLSLGYGEGTKAESSDAQPRFASIDDAIRELRAGQLVVVIDDEDRENEGELTMAAQSVTFCVPAKAISRGVARHPTLTPQARSAP
ncbi:MAG: 3,4-dihydroxy-2-butanone-4-phosphate synthase [Steroidobacteraceae bacterium]